MAENTVKKDKTGKAAGGGKVKITLVKGLSGKNQKHIATALSLGLKKARDFTIQPDNAQTRGKIAQISYLINVVEV